MNLTRRPETYVMASGPYDRSYYNRTGRFGFVYRLVNSDEEDMEEVAQEAVAAADDDDEVDEIMMFCSEEADNDPMDQSRTHPSPSPRFIPESTEVTTNTALIRCELDGWKALSEFRPNYVATFPPHPTPEQLDCSNPVCVEEREASKKKELCIRNKWQLRLKKLRDCCDQVNSINLVTTASSSDTPRTLFKAIQNHASPYTS